jgi:hypothetical protein
MFNSLCRYIAPDSVRAVPLPTELKKEMVELICHESGLVSPHCFDQVLSSYEIVLLKGACSRTIPSSVAYPGRLSRIPHPKTATKERGEKKIRFLPFFVATNITKFRII